MYKVPLILAPFRPENSTIGNFKVIVTNAEAAIIIEDGDRNSNYSAKLAERQHAPSSHEN